MKDRSLTREFIQRCKDANYDSLILTVDIPVAGNRERELRYGFSMPPKLNLAGIVQSSVWVAAAGLAGLVRLGRKHGWSNQH